jgi:hypothetical protein
MALVNPNIAMSYRAPEIQQPNMLADYAAIQQIQGGRQAQELNALKMQEAQAALTERNALRQLNPAAADYENQLFRVNPTLGIAYRKERSAADASAAAIAASQAAAAKSGFDLKASQRKFGEDLKRSLSANPSDENIIAFGQDAVLQGLYTPDQVKGTVDQLLALPAADRVRILSQAGATAADLKPPTPLNVTRLIQERDALPKGDPNIATYNAAIRKETEFAPRAITNVNLPSQEKAEQVDRGKMLVAEFGDISKAAKLAAKTLPSIDANLSILDKGFSTGFGTETVAAGAKVLAALGVADADKFATNAQVFQAKATEAVLQKQLEQKGPQTESDAQRIDQIGAQLGKTTAGNRFVLTTAKEQLKRDMEQRDFYAKWWQKNKTYDGAEDAWFSGEGGKSLFDRPALKAYAKSAEAAAAPPAANRPSLDNIFAPKK